jgi:4-hydroxybenzoyl-CoA thioesterase
MLTNKKTIHIEWGHCDPLGIVYYPRYFEFFDACTGALFEIAGLPKPQMLKRYAIAGIPMVETRARFLAPCAFGDTVVVATSISEWGTSSFSVEHKLFNNDALAAEAFEKRVWTVHSSDGSTRIRSEPIPKEVIERFS